MLYWHASVPVVAQASASSSRKAWQITSGKHSLDHRLLWDARRCCWRKTGICFCEVTHSAHPTTPLWLVMSRPGQNKLPMYLLANESVTDTALIPLGILVLFICVAGKLN